MTPSEPDPSHGASGSRATPAAAPAVVWLTWEHQRRNAGVAGALGARLCEMDLPGGRFRRYLRAVPATTRVMLRQRPGVAVAQNPSLVLAEARALWRA